MSSLHGLLLGRLSKQITCDAKMLKGMSDYKGMQFLHVHIRLGMACGDSASATTAMLSTFVKRLLSNSWIVADCVIAFVLPLFGCD